MQLVVFCLLLSEKNPVITQLSIWSLTSTHNTHYIHTLEVSYIRFTVPEHTDKYECTSLFYWHRFHFLTKLNWICTFYIFPIQCHCININKLCGKKFFYIFHIFIGQFIAYYSNTYSLFKEYFKIHIHYNMSDPI